MGRKISKKISSLLIFRCFVWKNLQIHEKAFTIYIWSPHPWFLIQILGLDLPLFRYKISPTKALYHVLCCRIFIRLYSRQFSDNPSRPSSHSPRKRLQYRLSHKRVFLITFLSQLHADRKTAKTPVCSTDPLRHHLFRYADLLNLI